MVQLFKDTTQEQQEQSLASFLPPGKAFASANNPDSNLGKLMTGLASTVKKVYDDVNNLSGDYDILFTEQLLGKWEKALGIPDQVFPGSSTSENTRRLDVLIKFAKMNVQTAQQMVTLVRTLGFQNVNITPLNQLAYPPYNVPFFPTQPPDSRYIITIYASGIFLDVPPYDVPFTPRSNSGGVLNLLMQIVKPMNVEILFKNPESAVITPTSFNGAACWLDAADTRTLQLGALNVVTQWNDKIIDNNAVAASLQPKWHSTIQNGYGVVRFAGAQTMEVIGSNINSIMDGDNTIYFIMNPNPGVTTNYALSYGTGATSNGFLRFQDFHIDTGDSPVEFVNPINSGFQIIRARRQGTLQGIAVNGVETTNNDGSNPVAPTDNVWLGSDNGISQFLNADVGEIVIYNQYLSDTQCSSLETKYFAPKWGI